MVRYARGTTDDARPRFPRLRERIDEDPARWLVRCEDGLDDMVSSLLSGMRSLERARNWQFVAGQLDIDDSAADAVDSVVDALADGGVNDWAGVDDRADARDAAARLRALWHADSPDAVREIQAAEVEGEPRRVVVALLNHRLDALTGAEPDSDDSAQEPDGQDSASDDAAESESQPVDDSGRPYQERYDRAVDLLSGMAEERVRGLYADEQERDEPRPAKLDAFEDVLDINTTTDMTTNDEAATAATEGTA